MFPTHLICHKFFFLFSSLTHFYSQQILLFSFYLSPSPLLLFSLRPRNAFPLPLHLLQSFSHIFHFPKISFFVILYSSVLYWKNNKINYMYRENPIQKNIVNPIPIPNTIAQACSQTPEPFCLEILPWSYFIFFSTLKKNSSNEFLENLCNWILSH